MGERKGIFETTSQGIIAGERNRACEITSVGDACTLAEAWQALMSNESGSLCACVILCRFGPGAKAAKRSSHSGSVSWGVCIVGAWDSAAAQADVY